MKFGADPFSMFMTLSKGNLVKPGAFYGYVQNNKGGAWAPDGGRIDVRKET
ncbi:hypothetical protein SH528x_007090 [Novipirellula sp. SH528]|uniref:hypothetical protein n=1 Tax=Novipirellula sp. SH528 TaxID=3454466 RepID=UPI003FA03D63